MTPPTSPQSAPRGYWRRLAEMAAPGDWLYRDAHYLVADMEIDAAAARRWVPAPLRLSSPARASLFTAWFPETRFGSVYHEAGLFLHVDHRRRAAVFCPWMLVDDDVALILGRELLGYPKKLGVIDVSFEGDRVSSSVSRRGAPLFEMEGTLGARVADPPPVLARPHRNVRGSLGLALPKVIAFTPRERVLEVRHAELMVRVTGSTRDPIGELGLGRVLASRLHRVDLGGALPPVPVGLASPLWFLRQCLLRAH